MENKENLCMKTIPKRLSNTLVRSPLRQSLYENQQLDQNNDDKERSKQDGQILLQRRLSEIRTKSSNQLGRLFNELEAKEHFQNCHKLFSENKISTKNVWHMQIIDILLHVVREKKQKNLLQFAGTTLDISAKVYGIRVDDVHSFILKLATNLTKTEKHNNNNNDDDSDDNKNDSDNDDQQDNTKKKTTRKRLKKRFQHNGDKKPTIDYDEVTLFAPLKKLQKPPFSIDDKVNVGAIENLLTMRLPLNPMGHTFRIFNKEKYQIQQRDITVENKSITNIELPNIKNCKICPQFDDFIINQFDANYEIQSNNSNNELIYDNNGLPIAELDGSIHDLLPVNDEDDSINDDCDDVVEQQLQKEQPSSGNIFEIVNTIPLNELEVNEYGFNPLIQAVSGKIIDKLWAGPAHWKIKYIRRANLHCSGNTTTITNQQTGKTKRRKKIIQTIDLNNSEDVIINYDLSKKITNKRKSSSTNFEKVTLPLLCAKLLDFNKCEQELFLKPGTTVRPHKSKNNENLEINVAAYNYNNQNDSLYCSQIDFDDNPNNDEDDCCNNDDILEIENFEQLIESPEMVQVSYLKYALHAKKINIKKLKKSMWEQLTHDNTVEKIEPTCFSKVYKTLPEKLDTKTRQELSVALAFNSVLYLCNEYCLKLLQTNCGNADFEIMKL